MGATAGLKVIKSFLSRYKKKTNGLLHIIIFLTLSALTAGKKASVVQKKATHLKYVTMYRGQSPRFCHKNTVYSSSGT